MRINDLYTLKSDLLLPFHLAAPSIVLFSGAVVEMKLVSAIYVKVKDKVLVTLKHKSMEVYEK